MKAELLKQRGFSLVEVTLALAVASFCLVAVFGLMPLGVNVSNQAVQQTAATAILTAVATDLRSTPSVAPGNTVQTEQFGIEIPANPVASNVISTKVIDGRYRLTVTFSAAADPKSPTLANLKVSWPGEIADPARANGFVQTLVAMDRN